MKASFSVRALAVLSLLALAAAADAADTATTQLTLTGTVPKTCNISISVATYTFPEAQFGVGFSGSAENIATVTEACNTSYDVSIRSDNNLGLVAAGVGRIPYVLTYGAFTSSNQDFSNFFEVFGSQTIPTGQTSRTRNVSVNYTVPASAAPGTYTDVLTFMVKAE